MNQHELDTTIASAQAGKEESYRRLFSEYSQTVFRLVSRFIANTEEAEELTQDTFLQAFGALTDFRRERAPFSNWLRRIAYNLCVDRLRRTHPQFVSLEDTMDADNISDTQNSTGETSEESIQALMLAISQLPEEEQTILQLYYFEGLSLQDIAYVVESNSGALANRLARIRNKLRKKLS